jgi:hypothetical protein
MSSFGFPYNDNDIPAPFEGLKKSKVLKAGGNLDELGIVNSK